MLNDKVFQNFEQIKKKNYRLLFHVSAFFPAITCFTPYYCKPDPCHRVFLKIAVYQLPFLERSFEILCFLGLRYVWQLKVLLLLHTQHCG